MHGESIGELRMVSIIVWMYPSMKTIPASEQALFEKFCKRDFCDEVRDFKIPEPEAVAS